MSATASPRRKKRAVAARRTVEKAGATLISIEAHRREQEDAMLAALSARIAGGEQDAMTAFYDATVARAYGLALCIVGAGVAAETVIEEAYCALWQEAAEMEGPALPWLLRRVRDLAVAATETKAVPDLLDVTMPQTAIHHALSDLTVKQRAAISAVLLGEPKDHAALAERLATTPAAAGSLLRAGLQRLQGKTR
ncbi:MAG: hypothetical protein HY255_01320 [Betaproteobacteria bacterium]|nr:hypothetical protein [Betaproteobacteria bacterium]